MYAPTPQTPLSVSALLRSIKDVLESALPLILVEGEISNLARPSSGHLYFSLKDANAQVRCAMFRNRAQLLRFRPLDGMQVLVRARISVYEPRGDMQLVIEHMEEAGLGALQRAFEQLKARLAAEGLFDPARKSTLPVLPARIGIITSPTGAAVRDVLHVLKRRFPLIPLRIYPASVQGERAADEIVRALAWANQRADCDVLLLVRGGGSLEDLWPFNEERVARAIAESRLPVISGVGHETDFTIADFVADARAPTPSAAASLAVPDASTFDNQLAQAQQRIRRYMRSMLERLNQRLDGLARHLELCHPRARLQRLAEQLAQLDVRRLRIMEQILLRASHATGQLGRRLLARHPAQQLNLRGAQLEGLNQRLHRQGALQLSQREAILRELVGKLHALSPLATLHRGYAIVECPPGAAISSVKRIQPGDELGLRMQDGFVLCSAIEVQPGE